MKKTVPIIGITICFFLAALHSCENTEKPNGEGGYLFAHMRSTDYGSLYYSISRDGKNWEQLNDSSRVDSLYRGHPDICKGADGNYYMIGAEQSPDRPALWSSKDLVTWRLEKHLPESLFLDNGTGHTANPAWFGAPKLFYDENSGNYLLSWHAPKNGIEAGDNWWKSMRTFYTLTPDFASFTTPERLFHFTEKDENMATIDAIVRKVGSTYFAIIKDERWPEDTPNGKTIRIATSAQLVGPYRNPGRPQTPNWYEAPSVVPKLNGNGWNIYAESYPSRYILFEADSLHGSWTAVDTNLEGVRHGCVLRINEAQYHTLTTQF